MTRTCTISFTALAGAVVLAATAALVPVVMAELQQAKPIAGFGPDVAETCDLEDAAG